MKRFLLSVERAVAFHSDDPVSDHELRTDCGANALAAPGSAPFLTPAAVAANIQSQAMMQKMLAAMLRQEAVRIAHENAVRKR